MLIYLRTYTSLGPDALMATMGAFRGLFCSSYITHDESVLHVRHSALRNDSHLLAKFKQTTGSRLWHSKFPPCHISFKVARLLHCSFFQLAVAILMNYISNKTNAKFEFTWMYFVEFSDRFALKSMICEYLFGLFRYVQEKSLLWNND